MAAKDAILKFIYDPNETAIILTGGAGTGKTSTISEVIKEHAKLEKMDKVVDPTIKKLNWYITATTNKAKHALKKSMPHMEVNTIHSLIGLGMFKGKLVVRRMPQVLDPSIIVIDECSYVDNRLLFLIQEQLPNSKIIYIGDAEQLAPVGMDYAPVFKQGYEVLELTEPMRQVNAPHIAAYCAELKAYIKANDKTAEFPTLELNDEMEHYSMAEFQDIVENVFVNQEQSTNDHRILSYSNKVVQAHNSNLFSIMHGRKDFQVGDTVLVNQYVCSLKTDEQVTIKDISKVTGTKPELNGKFFTVVGDTTTVKVYSPDNYKAADKELRRVIDDDLVVTPRDYEYLYERLADLRPLYACTVHKSQGSTFDTVYIDLNPFKYVKDPIAMARLLYVAISRASRKVIMTGDIG